MKTLSDIRFLIERELKSQVENDDVIQWCNQVNMDLGMEINIPADPEVITLTSTDLEYALPAELKIINRLRLQSTIDEGVDRELGLPYRIYNGKIIFPRIPWMLPDQLVIDYFKHMKYFEDITEEIDLEDRFVPVYVFYGRDKAKGIDTQEDVEYQNMKHQVQSYYSLSNEPVILNGRW